LIMSAFLGLIAAIIGIFISSMISRPLNKLIKIVDDITNNKKVEFLEKVPSNEIGKLHNAIKNLYKNLISESKNKNDAQNKVDLSLKIFEQALEGIIITDAENNIILVNKAFTNISGYELDEVYGKNPSILSSGLQDEEYYKKMWINLKTDGKWSGILKNRRKDGTVYEENLKVSSLKNENGKIINYIATFNSGF
jgi:PAS domain S-box-containing protein